MSKKNAIFGGVLFLIVLFFMGCVGGGLRSAHVDLKKKNYDAAILQYQAYLAQDPNSVEARSRLGFGYLKTGRLDEAISEFEKVLQIETGEPFSVLYLGLAHLNKGNIKKTIKIWEGYRNKKQPLVEAEIKRQLTLLQIAECQRYAQKAMAQEKQLQTIAPKANTIAVSQYKDLSSDKSMGAFQKGLASMITTDLSKINSLKVVERLRLQSLLEEMQLGQLGVVDEKTAPRVGRLLGAKYFVVGSLRRGSLSVFTSVNGISGSATVALNDFWKVSPAAVLTTAKALKVKLTPEEEKAIDMVHTKSLKAFVFYGQALMARDAGEWKKAKDLFVKALKADPLFDLAQKGAAGCPGSTSPALSDLSDMTFAQMAKTVESSINDAQADQGAADSQAESEAAEGGGGGGCG